MSDKPSEAGANPAERVGEVEPRRALSAATVEIQPGEGPADHGHGEPPPQARTPFELGAGRFEPRGELGRGGMGRVEHAFDRALGRAVAIKHVLSASEANVGRFGREARLTARLEHPGIVPVHDVGCGPDGMPYYVMRRIDGRPLAELVDRATLAARLAVIPNVLAACDAVAFAHARGIVHRDIKPHNILVGRFGETLVIDWGLAREIGPEVTASGSALPVDDERFTAAGATPGTPGFMAPEQARGEPVDARADVFALGATLFHVLAGRPPYHSRIATAMVAMVAAGRPPDWRALPAGVPADLRAILTKALASDPAARYADASELAADLRQFITGNLVSARQYGSLARMVHFMRRHRAAVAVAAVSAIVLGVVAVVSVRRVVAERDDANAARALAETRQRDAVDAADRLQIARAQEVAASDPVAAITLLRRLDASSSRWRDAWLAAAAAWVRGIPFGFRAAHEVMWVQIAADGHRAVTTSSDGDIAVYDLVARTRRSVATLPNATMCQWIGDHHLLCRAHDLQLIIVDTERATQRTLELRGRTMISDLRSRAVIETPDHQVVEIAGPDGRSRVLASGVELVGASPELDEVALWRGAALELWTPSRTLPVGRFSPGERTGSSPIQIRNHVVAVAIGDAILCWRVTGDRVVLDKRWPRNQLVRIALVDDRVYAMGVDDLYRDGLAVHSGLRPSQLHPTATGFGVIETDGGIAVIDRSNWLHLGPYPARFTRLDQSRDGRFLIAVTDTDEVLAWDLGALRPRTLVLDPQDEPVMLAPPYVWTRTPPRGLVRRELGTDRTAVVLPGMLIDAPGFWLGVGDDGRWAAVRTPVRPELTIYDATRDVRGTVSNVATQAADVDGPVFALADGRIGRWRPDSGASVQIGRLPSPPIGFSVGGTSIVALFQPPRLSRFDLSTGARTDAGAELAGGVRDVVVASTGAAWIAMYSGELWRWDPGRPPARIALTEPVDAIVQQGGRVLGRTSRSLLVLDADPVRAIPVASREVHAMAAGYAATLSQHGEVSVVDLDTGGRIVLPAAAVNDRLIARGDAVMFATGGSGDGRLRFDLIELAVPHDPAALRRWLRDVTNAVPPAGDQGGGWPSP